MSDANPEQNVLDVIRLIEQALAIADDCDLTLVAIYLEEALTAARDRCVEGQIPG